MSAFTNKKTTRFFTETEIVDALVNAGIPFKKVGMEIQADVNNTGHFTHKISLKKGGPWLSSEGGKGTFSQLLHAQKITPAKASSAAPSARDVEADLRKITGGRPNGGTRNLVRCLGH
ncbi:hypothetical protein BBC27_05135 [Acidithiobacillus ferrivorans]|uniref:Uncharacterized protein n=1 Tax=Acidithiobacillus ferrivorans TaxID=160808 RepID=A0A1B9C225_9PROT|nr:hypothetical protein [Acidithiobacillus ferrivorans]OCB04026.1 hypothetical protein BBC27_05135 [Acidithiobacillus ferrivorans]